MDNFKKREDDLRRHDNAKPKEVLEPKKNQDESYKQALEKTEAKISEIETMIEAKKVELTDVNKKIDRLEVIKSEIENLIKKIELQNRSLQDIITQFEFDKDTFKITYSAPLTEIENKIGDLKARRLDLQDTLDNSENANAAVSLHKKLEQLVNQKKILIDETDAEEKAYQKYLYDLKDWNRIKSSIIGDRHSEGSIEYLKTEIEYIENELPNLYKSQKKERLLKVIELFAQKQAISTVYSSIYEPVEKELQKLLSGFDEKIEFAVDIFISNKDIASKLLDYVNHSYKGVFNGKTEALNKMNEFINKTDLNNPESICNFINYVLECIYEDLDISSKKVKYKEKFYNLLTYLNYVDVEYSLKMGGRINIS